MCFHTHTYIKIIQPPDCRHCMEHIVLAWLLITPLGQSMSMPDLALPKLP